MSASPHVVFLSNDAVLDQTIAFLESFRESNPDLLLTMIPFADDLALCEALSQVYRFNILRDDLSRWDQLAQEFFPAAAGRRQYLNRLRKLAVFDVKSPTTIYIDTDTVVLRDFSFLSQPILEGKIDFICTATRNDPWVYNENYLKYPQLSSGLRFSDGFFAFNPQKIDSDIAYRIITENKDMYFDVRAADVYCQPLTNFVVDMTKLVTREVFRLFSNVSSQVWYAGAALRYDGEKVTSQDGRDVLFIHWAGPVDMSKDVPMKDLYLRYLERGKRRLAGGPAPISC